MGPVVSTKTSERSQSSCAAPSPPLYGTNRRARPATPPNLPPPEGYISEWCV